MKPPKGTSTVHSLLPMMEQMEQATVVGLLGRAGAGKSTAAIHMETTYGARRCSLAAPLKVLARELFDLSHEQVYGTQAQKETVDPRYGVSPRVLMIRLGDGARRAIGPRVWLDACFNGIAEKHAADPSTNHLFVIEDVRYENEVKAIVADGRFSGHVVKLVCPDSDSSRAYASAPSELSVDSVPASLLAEVITSSKSPGSIDLKEKVDHMVRRLLGIVFSDG